MNDTSPEPDSKAVRKAVERAEAAATRRRWINLAELVGIAGLVIAALGLWMSWSDRRADEQEKRAERSSESRARGLVLLGATEEHGGERLALKDSAHMLQSVEIRFPADLGVAAQTSIVDPHVEAGWIAPALLALTDKGPDAQRGRLPAIITATYWDGETQHSDSAIYDIVWATEGRLLRGRKLMLKGLLLRTRSASPARLDAIWAAEKPKAG